MFVIFFTLILISIIFVFTIIFSKISLESRLNNLEKEVLTEHHYEESIPKIEKIIDKLSANSKAHYLLAECYNDQGKFSLAIFEYNKVLRLKNYESFIDEIELHKNLAKIYIEQTKFEEAEKELLYAINLHPEEPQYYYDLGEIFYNSKKKEHLTKSIKYYSKVLELDPKMIAAQEKIIICQFNAEQYNKAMLTAESLFTKNQENAVANYYLGKLHVQDENLVNAIPFFEKCVGQPEYEFDSYLNLEICYYNYGKIDKSLEIYNKILSYAKKNDIQSKKQLLEAKYYAGLCYENLKDIEKAMDLWIEIDQIIPNFNNVKDKIEIYKYALKDDIFKEIIIGSMDIYKENTVKLLEKFEFSISNISELNLDLLRIIADKLGRRIITEGLKGESAIFFSRSDKPITKDIIEDLLDIMRSSHIANGYMFYLSEIYTDAKELALARSVMLFDKNNIHELLKKKNSR